MHQILQPETKTKQLLVRHKKVLEDLIFESAMINFGPNIKDKNLEGEAVYLGLLQAISTLTEKWISFFMDDDKLLIELMAPWTSYHDVRSPDLFYEEIILDFPLSYASYVFCEKQESEQILSFENDYFFGLSVGMHMSVYVIFLLCRYRFFQEITFYKIIKDFKEKQMCITYPSFLKDFFDYRMNHFNINDFKNH